MAHGQEHLLSGPRRQGEVRGRGRGEDSRPIADLAKRKQSGIGDLILLGVLQGGRDESHAARIERELRRYALVPLLGADLAPRVARNSRKLRELGITVRKRADMIIGTFRIEHRHTLLHDDCDFAPMEAYLGLWVA